MPKIYSYKKAVNAKTTKQFDVNGIEGAVELCEIAGTSYISIPDTAMVAKQPSEIDAQAVTLDDELKADIREKSYVVKFLKQQVREKIRDKYDLDDELNLLRLRDKDTTSWEEYDKYVEECRAWGETEMAKLGI